MTRLLSGICSCAALWAQRKNIAPEERIAPQDIIVNVTMWVDTRPAAASDTIDDAVNYATIAQAILHHIEQGAPCLIERLAAEIAHICFVQDARVEEAEVYVEKPRALPHAHSAGVCIYRTRAEMLTHTNTQC